LQYSNPQIPEGINTSKTHPLKEFFWLSSGVIAVIVAALLILILLSDLITGYIPFSVEKNLSIPDFPASYQQGPMHQYLQTLTDRVTLAQQLPDDMQINVHYIDNDTVNAFATLGGNVYFFRGLLEKLPNENALTMLIAHEVAHVKHRHPIKSTGRGIVLALGLSLVSSTAGDALVDTILGGTTTLTVLKFTRDMENQADKTALQTVERIYGHLAGADGLFSALGETSNIEPPEFFSTHPLTEIRISAIQLKTTNQKDSHITPLPEDYKGWLTTPDAPL